MTTQSAWVGHLVALKEDSAPLEDTSTLHIVLGYQVWRVKVATVVSTVKHQQDTATLAAYHAGEVMHDIRRGIHKGSLIGTTTTAYGQSYWGTQKSDNKQES